MSKYPHWPQLQRQELARLLRRMEEARGPNGEFTINPGESLRIALERIEKEKAEDREVRP